MQFLLSYFEKELHIFSIDVIMNGSHKVYGMIIHIMIAQNDFISHFFVNITCIKLLLMSLYCLSLHILSPCNIPKLCSPGGITPTSDAYGNNFHMILKFRK